MYQPQDSEKEFRIAASRGDIAQMQKLLEKQNVDINSQGPVTGKNALHRAVMTKQYKALEFLLHNGANRNVLDKEGNTALHIACAQQDLMAMTFLLLPKMETFKEITDKFGAEFVSKVYPADDTIDPTIQNNKQQTVLHLFAGIGASLREMPKMQQAAYSFVVGLLGNTVGIQLKKQGKVQGEQTFSIVKNGDIVIHQDQHAMGIHMLQHPELYPEKILTGKNFTLGGN